MGLSLFENDIAVIKLEDEAEFQCKRKTIWPACLPTQARQRTDSTNPEITIVMIITIIIIIIMFRMRPTSTGSRRAWLGGARQ